jgi:hypothetical protein
MKRIIQAMLIVFLACPNAEAQVELKVGGFADGRGTYVTEADRKHGDLDQAEIDLILM